MDFKEISIPHAFHGITQDNFDVHAEHIDFHWQRTGSFFLHNTWPLFKVCFESTGVVNKAWVEFASKTDEPAAMYHQDYGNIGFIGKAGRAHFVYESNSETFCNVNLELPACTADGYARIQISGNSCTGNFPNHYKGISGTKDLENFTGPEAIHFAKPGTYVVKQDIGNSESRLFAVVPPYELPDTECVWPGDADNNGVVNQYDLLYLGLGMGTTGELRPDSILKWQGNESADWPLATPTRQINFKNMDANGDGVIAPGDTLPIALHWGNAINPWKSNYFALPGPADSIHTHWNIGLPGGDTLQAGIQVEIPVVLGTPTVPVSGVLGLTFSISIDTSLLAAVPRFVASDSWLGDPSSDLIYLQKYFPGQNRTDIALTRTNGTTGGGFGEIGKMLFTLKQLPPDSLLPLKIFTSNGLILTPDETLIALPARRFDFVAGNPASSALVDLQVQGISISPNPAGESLWIQSAAEPLTKVEIYTSAGQLLHMEEYDFWEKDVQIAVGHFPVSVLWARIFTQNGFTVKKFVKAR